MILFKPLTFPPIICSRPQVEAFQTKYKILQITSIALAALATSVIAASFVYTIPLAVTVSLAIGAALLFRDVRSMPSKVRSAIEHWIDKNKEHHEDWIKAFGNIPKGSDKDAFLREAYLKNYSTDRAAAEKRLAGDLSIKFSRYLSPASKKIALEMDSNNKPFSDTSEKKLHKEIEELRTKGHISNATASPKEAQKVKEEIKQGTTLLIFRNLFEDCPEWLILANPSMVSIFGMGQPANSQSLIEIAKVVREVLTQFSFAALKPALFEGNLLLRSWMVP